jgi:glycosyltransferase involved in cell wall biosynthesis
MKGRPKLIFVNQFTGYLFIDIVNAFAEDHEVVLYTGKVEPLKTTLKPNVTVKYLTRYNRLKPVKRILTWVMFTVRLFFHLLFIPKGTELFLVTNPPFAPFVGYVLNLLRGVRYHILVYDVYPDALVQFGVIKNRSLLNRLWGKMNRRLFKKAATIYTLSSNMASLIRQYEPSLSIEVIPNWTDTSLIKPVEKTTNPFARQYKQEKKITVMYSGNMGITHAVEKIADLAMAFRNDPLFSFLLIGDGAKKAVVQQLKESRQLENLSILPYQPSDMLPFSLSCADIGIVTLSSGAEDLSVPSKTYNLLAAGVALMVIASGDSELARLVRQYGCGVQFEEKDTDEMIGFLQTVKQNPALLNDMKVNARKASYNFTPENAYQYKTLLKSAAHV